MKKIILLLSFCTTYTMLFAQTESRQSIISLLSANIKMAGAIYIQEGRYNQTAELKPSVEGVTYSYSGDQPGGGHFNYNDMISWSDICGAERTWLPGNPNSTFYLKINLKQSIRVTITYQDDRKDSFANISYLIFKAADFDSTEATYTRIRILASQLGRLNGCE